jgi:6-phosphogluconolactonase
MPTDLRADPRVTVLADPAALARAAADLVTERAADAIAARGRFTIALAGGSTPKALYALLAAQGRIDWGRVEVFFGDERHVPPSDAQSNFRMAEEALLSKVPLVPERVHRIRGEDPDARAAALAYEETLRRALAPAPGAPPRLDLVLLGIGPDAHTASLFPGTWAVRETRLWVAWPWVDKLGTYRVSMTQGVINAARAVVFLVAGKDKVDALRAVLAPDGDPDRHPARVVRPTDGELRLLVDEAAAGG